MAKKRTSDTTAGAVALFQAARHDAPAVPECASLRAGALPYWDAIVAARPASAWPQAHLIVAAMAANAMADAAEFQAMLSAEGQTVTTASGSLKAHPAAGLLDSSTKRMLALLRALGLSAADARDAGQRDAAFRNARRVVDDLDGEPLLAR